mgnify:CR=1 FL=1
MTAQISNVKIRNLRRDLMDLEEVRDEALEEGDFLKVMELEQEMDEVIWAIQNLGGKR